jgi:hypothetical protein
VDVERVSVASIGSGDNVGLSVDCEADVAEESFIEDMVNGVAVVDGALRFAHYSGAGSGTTGHGIDFLGRRQEW